MNHRSRSLLTACAAVGVFLVAGCSGGSSDVMGGAGGGPDGSGGTINLFAYGVPKPGYDKVTAAFGETEEGAGVRFNPSYGASGDQSRKVQDGAQADLVSFSVEPEITRLVEAGLVDAGWNEDSYGGVPFGSVVTLVVREGNPKNIRDWDDLLRPGVEVVTPNPFSSGSAKWNLLAPYAAESEGGKNPQAGLDYLGKLVGEHVKVQPKSGREATEMFLQGTGDVLLSYENEALFTERKGDPVEHVTPPVTFKVENPVAVVSTGRNAATAVTFRDFLYTPAAQRAWAEAGFRPVDAAVMQEFAADFPPPQQLWTVADLGGWDTVDQDLFEQDSGRIAAIYENATT
ncbi:extracellular solute-binding protein [Rhodococcus sp. SGAir0479]|uniref:extracellular solute-binding protein n=1 Tax=Rhodococcus sp. SGAir0479 TaxID=2567884 RepID=UPI0010CCD43C|nr:extracellular solute-binding protein [Rhodococcus sp. SGAir0479]QCQ91638.1 extracellular solute-binding protein [Rhodococcus sp. SGAir0479]